MLLLERVKEAFIERLGLPLHWDVTCVDATSVEELGFRTCGKLIIRSNGFKQKEQTIIVEFSLAEGARLVYAGTYFSLNNRLDGLFTLLDTYFTGNDWCIDDIDKLAVEPEPAPSSEPTPTPELECERTKPVCDSATLDALKESIPMAIVCFGCFRDDDEPKYLVIFKYPNVNINADATYVVSKTDRGYAIHNNGVRLYEMGEIETVCEFLKRHGETYC